MHRRPAKVNSAAATGNYCESVKIWGPRGRLCVARPAGLPRIHRHLPDLESKTVRAHVERPLYAQAEPPSRISPTVTTRVCDRMRVFAWKGRRGFWVEHIIVFLLGRSYLNYTQRCRRDKYGILSNRLFTLSHLEQRPGKKAEELFCRSSSLSSTIFFFVF